MSISRREFLGAAAAGVFASGAAQGGPRNLIFIIADQHSDLALGCNGHKVVQTPRLDAFARSGVTFTHAHTAGLICSPSRASLDTGLHVHAHGVRTNGVRLP